MQWIQWIREPWHWAISGAGLALVMFLLVWYGNRFGVSANLRNLCAMCGIGKNLDYFRFEWKDQSWNLLFILGAVVGGYLAGVIFPSSDPVQIADSTRIYLEILGIQTPSTLEEGNGFVPSEIYNLSGGFNYKQIIILIVSGLLVGFGTRYANGCTSGHAITGLSNLQWSSFVAVIGFFIGGLIMTWVFLPSIIQWLNV